MHAHLRDVLGSFTTHVVISKPILSFKPDCAIVHLRAGIEFAYADNLEELKVAICMAYMKISSAYAGSFDWTRYYTVIYQTGPYGTEKQVHDALRISGNAKRWQAHLVTPRNTPQAILSALHRSAATSGPGDVPLALQSRG